MLFDAAAIAARVRELGEQISRDYAGKVPVFVGVLSAAVTFLADLTRAVTIPAEFDVIAITTFSESEGIRFEKDTAQSIEGRHVILVVDAIDSGRTVEYLVHAMRRRNPASLALCLLLDRPRRPAVKTEIAYKGFEIPDVFVVGYGLDAEGRYRELPALYARGDWPS